jgi:hypothetical protein
LSQAKYWSSQSFGEQPVATNGSFEEPGVPITTSWPLHAAVDAEIPIANAKPKIVE